EVLRLLQREDQLCRRNNTREALDVHIRAVPEGGRVRRQVKRIGRCRVVRQEAKRVRCVERDRQLLSVIVVRYGKAAAENAFTILSKKESTDAALEVRRPCYRYTRLEVVLVSVVHRRSAILFT